MLNILSIYIIAWIILVFDFFLVFLVFSSSYVVTSVMEFLLLIFLLEPLITATPFELTRKVFAPVSLFRIEVPV